MQPRRFLITMQHVLLVSAAFTVQLYRGFLHVVVLHLSLDRYTTEGETSQ